MLERVINVIIIEGLFQPSSADSHGGTGVRCLNGPEGAAGEDVESLTLGFHTEHTPWYGKVLMGTPGGQGGAILAAHFNERSM